MSDVTMKIRSAFAHPARRRFWLTVGSGGLIAIGLLARYGFGMIELWSALMVAAALLAGSDIAVRAWRALRVRHLSIELLVTIAAVGALAIGEVWESAAVTFLFMLGAWLEVRTMGQTRGALKELLDAAPMPPHADAGVIPASRPTPGRERTDADIPSRPRVPRSAIMRQPSWVPSRWCSRASWVRKCSVNQRSSLSDRRCEAVAGSAA